MQLKNTKLKALLTLVIIATCFLQATAANNWNVPADKKAKNSYIKFDAATSKQGEDIYTKNCVSCHGNMGKDNNLKSLQPLPPDLSKASSQLLTDGELFYILTIGRAIMPSFQSILSEEDRWKVISYIRSFNKNYVQVLSQFDSNKAKLVKINLNFNTKTNQIEVQAKANGKAGIVALKDAEIGLFAKRYFGKIPIDDTQHANSEGVAVFNFPKDLPGDKAGNVILVVNLKDENYGEIALTKSLKIGIPTDKPALNQERAIWNIMAKAPYWIIFLYLFGILAFGAVLLYLIYSLNRLKKAGTE